MVLGAKFWEVLVGGPENRHFPYLVAPAGHMPLQARLGTALASGAVVSWQAEIRRHWC